MTSLTLVRRIGGARRRSCFDALTTPEGIACWWGPDDGPVLLAETDVRVGGRFRVRFRMLDGSEHESRGEYLEVCAPQRLAMSWRWVDGEDPGELRVEIDLRAIPEGTELTFTHSRLADEETPHAATRAAGPARSTSSNGFHPMQGDAPMKHEVVSQEQWLDARRALLAEEKAWTRERDRLAEKRRALPWVRVDKDYVFDGVGGAGAARRALRRAQPARRLSLHVRPGLEEGCPGCSLLCDHVDGARQHFEHNDVSFVAVSRGPIERLEAYRKRMGWKLRWVSSAASDFNLDFHVSFPETARGRRLLQLRAPARSRASTSSRASACSTRTRTARSTTPTRAWPRRRGVLGVYGWLDMVPKGRNETGAAT